MIALWRQPNTITGMLMRLSFYVASRIYAACHMYFCKRLSGIAIWTLWPVLEATFGPKHYRAELNMRTIYEFDS